MSEKDCCIACNRGPIKYICQTCREFVCEHCSGSHRCAYPILCQLPCCANHKDRIATYCCGTHLVFLCNNCFYEHKSCEKGKIRDVPQKDMENKFKSQINNFYGVICKVFKDPNTFREIDSREQRLRDSYDRVKSDISRTFSEIRAAVDRREQELLKELDDLYEEKSGSKTKEEFINICKHTADVLNQLSKDGPGNFIDGVNKMRKITDQEQVIDQMYKGLNVPPCTLSAKLDISYISGTGFSKWGKIECDDGSDNGGSGTSNETHSKEGILIDENVFNSLNKSSIFKGELRCQQYAYSVFSDTLYTIKVGVYNTGKKEWNSNWYIYQVGGYKLLNFLPQGFKPQPLASRTGFEIVFYFTFKKGVHKSGVYKFALVNKEKKERMSKTLDLNITVSDYDHRGGYRRRPPFSEDKLRPRNPDYDKVGSYRFKSKEEIDKIISGYFK